MRPMILHSLFYFLALLSASVVATSSQADTLTVEMAYVSWTPDPGPIMSNVIPEPSDAGLQGAQLAVVDNNSTGRFLKHDYQLLIASESELPATLDAARGLHAQGVRLFVTNLPSQALAELAKEFGTDSLLINAGSYDDALRTDQCLANVLHTLPSRAMLTDALAQFLKVRKLTRWLLISGPTADDIAYAAALKRSAKRFGHKVVAEKVWSFDTDLRRTAQAEVPLFTQTVEYDVVVVADERGDFGEYIPYNTWYPRPVAGTQGLTPLGWHKVVETYGAAQLQKRFEQQAGRWMNSLDFAAWLGIRTFGAAVTTLNSADAAAITALSLSDKLPLDGFKGRKLSYRTWNGQLRQPIPLVQPRALVSNSPQEGFLHPQTDLDTLGFDQPESQCRLL
ncbi:MAG TPA: branched-chain amino acid ABC transporter substrate-binding protein [Pseudomonas xinjiangensis]|uniref:Branched-chain amino acid ABC transporter substrate-binding protein n=3 Tax=root TaxID=1 RepID=A0A7V1FQZ6_9GAMM|nr:ABC transporter substrate-binding protein [Halopseudomonas pelagia]PCC98219.1 branched-chain amino acid ABC transporter substrate-binding protein [Halopseudomonas pelagia]QFY57144.1 branched-chain amino acid ABC transporter substrate-binding protein [Halopseudomonas pelagia]HDZ55067.1 branched-chain amino acid ABC transporter substrate-binding protein [Halopseudomonas xinjiangensis]HEC46946.1 branched-chain amino acid ABC transporter substrate-binding protein [Halopseudomonas xinjiangensis]